MAVQVRIVNRTAVIRATARLCASLKRDPHASTDADRYCAADQQQDRGQACLSPGLSAEFAGCEARSVRQQLRDVRIKFEFPQILSRYTHFLTISKNYDILN